MANPPAPDAARAKKELRRELRRKLEMLTPATRAAASAEICRRLQSDRRIADAPVLAAYMALDSEPDLRAFLQARLARGLPILLPRIVGELKAGMMELREVRSWDEDFVAGPLGILQPGEHCPVRASTLSATAGAVDVMLVPGLAFDRDNHRMGKGGGHYDRLLATGAVKYAVGIGFLCQRVNAVPVAAHDVKMNAVVVA